MKFIRGFFAFWYDFIIGDAWEVAAGVVATLVFIGVLINNNQGNQNLAEMLGFVFVAAVVGVVGISLLRE